MANDSETMTQRSIRQPDSVWNRITDIQAARGHCDWSRAFGECLLEGIATIEVKVAALERERLQTQSERLALENRQLVNQKLKQRLGGMRSAIEQLRNSIQSGNADDALKLADALDGYLSD